MPCYSMPEFVLRTTYHAGANPNDVSDLYSVISTSLFASRKSYNTGLLTHDAYSLISMTRPIATDKRHSSISVGVEHDINYSHCNYTRED